MSASTRVVILGAGLTGLACAARLLEHAGSSGRVMDIHLVEKEDVPGGLCRTEHRDGFMFDRTGHLLHFKSEEVHAWVAERTSRLIEGARNAAIVWRNELVPYPFQTHLAYTDEACVEDCLTGLCERDRDSSPASFGEMVEQVYGSGIAGEFLRPYNEKLTQMKVEDLAIDWAGRFFPKADTRAIVRGALRRNPLQPGYNSSFYYPERGIGCLIDALLDEIQPHVSVHTSATATQVDPSGGCVRLSSGEAILCDHVVSTIPLPELASIYGLDDGDFGADDMTALRGTAVLNLNWGIDADIPWPGHWVYVPQGDNSLYRVGFNSRFTPAAAPDGCTAIYAEWSYTDTPPQLDQVRESLRDVLDALGLSPESYQVLSEAAFDLRPAYVQFTHGRASVVNALTARLQALGVHCIGRYGRWGYLSMEDCILDAWGASEAIATVEHG